MTSTLTPTTVTPSGPTGSPSTDRSTTALTPTLRATARRWLFWVGAAAVLLLIAFISLATAGSSGQRPPLDPESPAPNGAQALAEVLRDQGVDVTVTRSLDATSQTIANAATTTLIIDDPQLLLTDEQLAEAVALAETVIIVNPSFSELKAVAPDVDHAGSVDGILDADCDFGPVERAGTVTGDGTGFRTEDAGALTCLGSGDDVYSLIEVATGGGRLIVLGATTALTNENIIEEGNAAFALGLLGENPSLVWYLPSFDDIESDVTIAELTPTWVTPVVLLLFVTALVAAIWRGRRLGPLVVENLPVTVRASETMLGRARLYARSASHLRALDALRVGTIQRLAAACGLSRLATVDEVIDAVAAVTGAMPHDIRALLLTDAPRSDRDLIAYSDALLTLERDVAKALRP